MCKTDVVCVMRNIAERTGARLKSDRKPGLIRSDLRREGLSSNEGVMKLVLVSWEKNPKETEVDDETARCISGASAGQLTFKCTLR